MGSQFYFDMLKVILQQVGLFAFGGVALELLRLFVLPGALRRRKRLGYFVANYGKPPSGLPKIELVANLSERVVRVLGMNPGRFTLQGSNTYVVGSKGKRVLIDTGDGNQEYLDLLCTTLNRENATLSHIVITHEHEDHVGGIIGLRKLFPEAKIWKRLHSSTEVDPSGKPYDAVLENGTLIVEDDVTLRAVLTPGHTSDHVALVLEEEDAIFTGDCVLGNGTAVFEDLHQYVGSLRILLRELNNFKTKGRLYPGHGIVVEDGAHKVEEYIKHRLLREEQILQHLETGKKSVNELVELIYADQHLSWILKKGAKRSVVQHLFKLEKENKVKKESEGVYLLVPS